MPNLTVWIGFIQTVFQCRYGLMKLDYPMFLKIQDIKHNLPIDNITMTNLWLWKMTNPAILV